MDEIQEIEKNGGNGAETRTRRGRDAGSVEIGEQKEKRQYVTVTGAVGVMIVGPGNLLLPRFAP